MGQSDTPLGLGCNEGLGAGAEARCWCHACRPPLPDGKAKTGRVEWRTHADRKARAQALAGAAGLSLSAWLDSVVDAQ